MNLHQMALLSILLMRHRRMRAACRQTWSRSWIQRRQGNGVYANIIRELSAEDPEMFRQYHRLDFESFKKILRMVGPVIQKQETIMHSSISPGERLAVTLRFLATGA